MYRGDKDLRLGIELCKQFGWRYTMLVPDVASPADRAFFNTEKFPMEVAKKFFGYRFSEEDFCIVI